MLKTCIIFVIHGKEIIHFVLMPGNCNKREHLMLLCTVVHLVEVYMQYLKVFC